MASQAVPRALASVVVAFLLWCPASGWACAACYGQSDSPMAAGMNWGILSLLAIIVGVLGGVGGFFVYLARRASVHPTMPPPGLETAPAESSSATA